MSSITYKALLLAGMLDSPCLFKTGQQQQPPVAVKDQSHTQPICPGPSKHVSTSSQPALDVGTSKLERKWVVGFC